MSEFLIILFEKKLSKKRIGGNFAPPLSPAGVNNEWYLLLEKLSGDIWFWKAKQQYLILEGLIIDIQHASILNPSRVRYHNITIQALDIIN